MRPKLPDHIQALIFDLDGTLLDSMGIWEQIDREFLQERGFSIPTDYFDLVSAMSFAEVAAYTIKRFDLSETVEELMQEWNQRAIIAYATRVDLKPEVTAYLQAVSGTQYRRAIATSLPPELYQPVLQRHQLSDYFEEIVTTHEVGQGKQDPAVFLETARRLGLSPNACLLYEDILPAVQSAKQIGMPVYAVYDAYSQADWPQMQRIADGWLLDFSQAPL